MSLAEIERAIESKVRTIEIERKNAAIMVYNLADLIGYSVARIHNKNNKMPTLAEAFPNLFNAEDEKQKKEQLEIDRFKAQLQAFSNSHNKKLKGG